MIDVDIVIDAEDGAHDVRTGHNDANDGAHDAGATIGQTTGNYVS